MTKSEAGSMGGRATVEKKGREYMREIGKRGAAVLWSKYRLVPVEQTKFAMVNRSTGEVVRVRNS